MNSFLFAEFFKRVLPIKQQLEVKYVKETEDLNTLEWLWTLGIHSPFLGNIANYVPQQQCHPKSEGNNSNISKIVSEIPSSACCSRQDNRSSMQWRLKMDLLWVKTCVGTLGQSTCKCRRQNNNNLLQDMKLLAARTCVFRKAAPSVISTLNWNRNAWKPMGLKSINSLVLVCKYMYELSYFFFKSQLFWRVYIK